MNTALKIYLPDGTNIDEELYSLPLQMTPEIFEDSISDMNFQEEGQVSSTSLKNIYSASRKLHLIPPTTKPFSSKFKILQSWDGRVVDVGNKEFSAIITDKTNPDLEDELVTMDIDEISPADSTLLESGAVFYWSIGYADYKGRGRVKESKIRFRRLPGWSQNDIDRAQESGAELANFFK